MGKVKFPSVKEVSQALRNLNANVEGECDVRLQVYPDESRATWALRWGSSDYDRDHRGYWGASSVPGVNNGRVGRFNSRNVAKDLLEQAKEQAALDTE